jgi:uncharacterized protein YkwD
MQKQPLRHAIKITLPSLLALLLASCGGGGSADPSATNTASTPSTPSQQTQAAQTTVSGQLVKSNEVAQPVQSEKTSCSASIAQQQALALLNAARAVARQCGATTYPAVPALAWSSQLEAAASAHSQDMAKRNFFEHNNPDGVSPSQRITASGYVWRASGENIAAGYDTLETAMDGWLKSPGHCANIMNASFRDYGVACATNPSSEYGTYWTQAFGARR